MIIGLYELDQTIYEALRAGKDSEAISTARLLLGYAELPLYLHARACLILACSDVPDYLDMAKEAVHVAELANTVPNAGEVEAKLLRECRTIYDKAQADFDDEQEDAAAGSEGGDDAGNTRHA